MALKHKNGTDGDGSSLQLDLTGLNGTEIGYAVREQLSPRSQGRAIVAATSGAGMFGRKYTTDAEGRKNAFVTPYPWTASGSTIIPMYRDGSDVYLAVVHNKRKDGERLRLRLPEGYMHSIGCPELPGGLPAKYQANDEAEIKISFQGIDHKIAYGEHPPLPAEEPDRSLEDTAIREAREETGLALTKDQLKRLGIYESDGAIHTIAAYYLADLSTVYDARPELRSQDPDEIDEIYWIQAKDIEVRVVSEETKYFYRESEILPKYAKFIAHAMYDIRQHEINGAAGPTVTTTENLFAQMNALLEDEETIEEITGLTFEIPSESYLQELGSKAELRHQKILALATLYSEKTTGRKLFQLQPFTRAEIEETIDSVMRVHDDAARVVVRI